MGSYIEAGGGDGVPFSPVLLHGEKGSNSEPFSVSIFKLIEGKCQIILQNVVDLIWPHTVLWEETDGKIKDVLFKRNPFFHQESSTDNCPLIPKDEARPGKPHPACWCKQSGPGADRLPDRCIVIGFENTFAQWRWAKRSLPCLAFHFTGLMPYFKVFSHSVFPKLPKRQNIPHL